MPRKYLTLWGPRNIPYRAAFPIYWADIGDENTGMTIYYKDDRLALLQMTDGRLMLFKKGEPIAEYLPYSLDGLDIAAQAARLWTRGGPVEDIDFMPLIKQENISNKKR